MKKMTLAIVVIFSVAFGAIGHYATIKNYEQKILEYSETACDFIQPRAQAGSTRDVHDQIYSYLRKRSPDQKANVVIKNGAKELGSLLSSDDQKNLLVMTCTIENAPDYEIKMFFHKKGLFQPELLVWIFSVFLLLISFVLVITSSLRAFLKFWGEEVFHSLRSDYGLEAKVKSSSQNPTKL